MKKNRGRIEIESGARRGGTKERDSDTATSKTQNVLQRAPERHQGGLRWRRTLGRAALRGMWMWMWRFRREGSEASCQGLEP